MFISVFQQTSRTRSCTRTPAVSSCLKTSTVKSYWLLAAYHRGTSCWRQTPSRALLSFLLFGEPPCPHPSLAGRALTSKQGTSASASWAELGASLVECTQCCPPSTWCGGSGTDRRGAVTWITSSCAQIEWTDVTMEQHASCLCQNSLFSAEPVLNSSAKKVFFLSAQENVF